MRVLHINLNDAGLGRYGLLYGKALDACAEVEAISVFDEKLLCSNLLREHAQAFDYRLVQWSGNTFTKLKTLRKLRQIAVDFRPDIIHDTAGSFAKNIVIWPLLYGLAPLVITEHDPKPHLGMQLTAGGRLARRISRHLVSQVFVHGPWCRQLLQEQGWPTEKISMIRHGHLGLFDRGAYQDVARQDRTVLFFGELRFNKGIDLLPEIARCVVQRFPDATFIVAGSRRHGAPTSAWARRIHNVIEEMQQQPYFEVHDRFIPDEEVEYFFRRAAITIMPYREATQSGIAMIAMPMASAVVTTNVGDIPEVVIHGETGFIAEPGVERFAHVLIELLENPERVRRVGNAAREFALHECDWQRTAQDVLDRCEQVILARRTHLLPSDGFRLHERSAGRRHGDHVGLRPPGSNGMPETTRPSRYADSQEEHEA